MPLIIHDLVAQITLLLGAVVADDLENLHERLFEYILNEQSLEHTHWYKNFGVELLLLQAKTLEDVLAAEVLVWNEALFKHEVSQVLKRQLGGYARSVKFCCLIEPIRDDLEFFHKVWLSLDVWRCLYPGSDVEGWAIIDQSLFSKLLMYP